MGVFRAIRGTSIFAEPNPTLEPVGKLEEGLEVHGDPAPGFSGFIKLLLPNLSDKAVFVFREDLADTAPRPPEPIFPDEQGAFCGQVTWAAREYQVDRDYLLTIAFCLSNNLTEIGTAASLEVGPFKFSADRWTAAITDGPAKSLGLTVGQRYLWFKQPAIAALVNADCLKRLTTELGHTPTRSELFFGYLFGSDAPGMLKGDRSKAISGTPPPDSYAATLKAASPTVAAALTELTNRLSQGYEKAKALVDAQPDDVRLLYPEAGTFPWLALARAEMKKGVAEIPGAVDNEQIKAYHAAAGVQGGDGTSWCGSFITWCLRNCGEPIAAEGIKTPDSARASWWAGFGVAAPNPPSIGTIVVLKPQAEGSSGHVGFLEEGSDAKHVMLLAGNQGGVGGQTDHVGIVRFGADQVVHLVLPTRWQQMHAAIAQSEPAGDLHLEQFDAQQRVMAQKIIAAFAAAGYGKLQQAAAVANAKAESNLDPNSHAGGNEDSVGLFQLNRRGGEGVGHSVEELRDPDRNIALVISVFQKRIPGFKTAKTLASAVEIFVHDYERPKRPDDAIRDRLAIAKTILT